MAVAPVASVAEAAGVGGMHAVNNVVAIHLEALADAYAERIAICVADGIFLAEARATAEAEIGAELARRFGLEAAA